MHSVGCLPGGVGCRGAMATIGLAVPGGYRQLLRRAGQTAGRRQVTFAGPAPSTLFCLRPVALPPPPPPPPPPATTVRHPPSTIHHQASHHQPLSPTPNPRPSPNPAGLQQPFLHQPPLPPHCPTHLCRHGSEANQQGVVRPWPVSQPPHLLRRRRANPAAATLRHRAPLAPSVMTSSTGKQPSWAR
jgi:hypothetical protein